MFHLFVIYVVAVVIFVCHIYVVVKVTSSLPIVIFHLLFFKCDTHMVHLFVIYVVVVVLFGVRPRFVVKVTSGYLVSFCVLLCFNTIFIYI